MYNIEPYSVIMGREVTAKGSCWQSGEEVEEGAAPCMRTSTGKGGRLKTE
jgi:hypothetical protein